MTYTLKKRIVIAFLLASFVWPPVHYVLVDALGLNPWNWWGWAMYTKPVPRVQASAVSLTSGRDLDLRQASRADAAAVQAAYKAFSSDQMELGGLRKPEDFATALLRAFPNEEGVRIVVRRVVLDRESAMIEPRENPDWVYEYRRSDLGL